uniref:Cell adhesion molecule L1-like b n=1 Tax=Astyanax mexicanus TaxID=7994 RepID=A0A8B9HED8_ASTMX
MQESLEPCCTVLYSAILCYTLHYTLYCIMLMFCSSFDPPVCFYPVEQLPSITDQSPASLIALPFEESFPVKCEATGNPEPEFKWTKNGQDFDPFLDPRLLTQEDSGTFVIPNNGNLTEFQGVYRCYAANKLGTAMSEKIEFIVPNVPKFPKEKIEPIEVEEGQPVILECNPPKGIPPLQIYWMTIGLQHIEQDERVSVGLNGNLYFSNAVQTDSRRDYCCFAAFPRIRTIVQKTAMSVISMSYSDSSRSSGESNSILERKPSLLLPSGDRTNKHLVKGEELLLECIGEGFPTPQMEWVKLGQKLPERAVVENHGKLLTIENVNEEDEGKYMCKAINAHGEAVHYFHVTVEEPPEWEVEPKSQLNMIGANVVIECSASGRPTPTVGWRVNGRPLSGTTVYISHSPTACYHIYIYIAIYFRNLRPLILTENGVQYSVVEGKAVMMHCRVFSSPLSAITWSKVDSASAVEGPRFSVYKNGSLEIHSVEREDEGEYSCFTENTEGKSAISAVLEVKGEAEESLMMLLMISLHCSLCNVVQNEGNLISMMLIACYWLSSTIRSEGKVLITRKTPPARGLKTCRSENALKQICRLCFTLSDVPDAPEDVVLAERRDRTVKLKWIPGDDHNSTTTEFIVEFEESQWKPGSWRELMRVPGNHHSALLKLHGHVDYSFRVSGVNEVGRGRSSGASERYRTPASAPDKNPENIKIEGHLPHEMDINWEPLPPMEHNGPGLEYKVSYRRQGSEEDWQEHMVKRHSFVVKNTPTFVPYEVKIQARNHAGWAPEPKTVVAYSGEDFPSAAPDDVEVEVMNNSVVKVSWSRVHKDKLHGHLGGYRVILHPHVLLLPPIYRTTTLHSTSGRGRFPIMPLGLVHASSSPWSLYILFFTDEFLYFLSSSRLVNNTEEVGPLESVNITGADTTKWLLQDLEPVSRYRFYLQSCTRAGCGPAASEESTTVPEAHLASIHGGISNQGWFIGLMCAVALLTLIVLIACFVNRNKGGKYSVKEKEDLHPDVESQGMNDDTFCEYSDNDEKPLKGSQPSLTGDMKDRDSGDSMVDYGDEDVHFNEDGSFIGEYGGRKERVSTEIKATNQSTA